MENREKIRRNKVYIMVSNHQSVLDILVLFRLMTHFKWVSKIENFRIPVIGWNMLMNRYIKVKRGDKKSVAKMMEACKRNLKSGSSIMMFPEGTRSANGEIRNFKEGAFVLAKETSMSLLPVVLDGSGKALPKKGILLKKKQLIRVKILDEIAYEEISGLSLEDLIAGVRDKMINELANMRNFNVKK